MTDTSAKATEQRPRRGSISNWLFGPNAPPQGLNSTAATSLAENAVFESDAKAVTGDRSTQEPQHIRSGSMSEKLGLTKVPTHDHESILRGDFGH